jgi:uncharacterized repeat protein (TIGR03803 family)
VSKIVYQFAGLSDGNTPAAALLPAPNGAFFGVTFAGGSTNCGTVFRLNPPAAPSKVWTKTLLHDFADKPSDGCNPAGSGLVAGSDGTLYGATASGGSGNAGAIFSLKP